MIESFPPSVKQVMTPIALKKGEILIREGDPVNYGYVFTSGTVDVIKNTVKGTDFLLEKDHAEPFCCFMDIFSEQYVQCATIQAVTDVKGWRIPRSACFTLLREKSLFQEVLIRRWAKMFYRTNINSVLYPMHSFRYKLINFILTHVSEEHGTYSLPISRTDLTKAIGCSRRTLFRLLKDLKDECLVSPDCHGIILSESQHDALQAEFDEWAEETQN